MFAPFGEASRPVYSFGTGTVTTPVFTCPVSAIPSTVWEVLELFLQCRAMKALPLAGGVLDQPFIVRRAFPILESDMAASDTRREIEGQVAVLAGALGQGHAPRRRGR